MLFIFKDERRGAGLFPPNPQDAPAFIGGQRCKMLEVGPLPHISRLATGKIRGANDVIVIENTP